MEDQDWLYGVEFRREIMDMSRRTGAGPLVCRDHLIKADRDIEKAVKALREASMRRWRI